MPSSSNKKLSILYTLQVLRDYSDESHFLSQTDIVNKINNIYGMTCERKSIATNIDSLIDFGYDIVKTNKGAYLARREFEPSEIKFLVDAVFSSKSISSKHSRELAKNLSQFLSIYQRKQYKYVYKADELNRTDNKELFYNIDIISEAIENNKQIEFDYIRNGYKNNNTKKHPYKVNPYCLINNQGKYFLVCNYDYFDEIGNYKLERIHNIKILNTPIKPVTKVKGFENGLDIAKYANENIYMFSTKTINATVKIYRDSATAYVEEWFGKNASIYEKENSIFADITANETSLIYWCLQYGEDIELLSPKDTRIKITEKIDNIQKKYKGE